MAWLAASDIKEGEGLPDLIHENAVQAAIGTLMKKVVVVDHLPIDLPSLDKQFLRRCQGSCWSILNEVRHYGTSQKALNKPTFPKWSGNPPIFNGVHS